MFWADRNVATTNTDVGMTYNKSMRNWSNDVVAKWCESASPHFKLGPVTIRGKLPSNRGNESPDRKWADNRKSLCQVGSQRAAQLGSHPSLGGSRTDSRTLASSQLCLADVISSVTPYIPNHYHLHSSRNRERWAPGGRIRGEGAANWL